jgi:hypothetical protein
VSNALPTPPAAGVSFTALSFFSAANHRVPLLLLLLLLLLLVVVDVWLPAALAPAAAAVALLGVAKRESLRTHERILLSQMQLSLHGKTSGRATQNENGQK